MAHLAGRSTAPPPRQAIERADVAAYLAACLREGRSLKTLHNIRSAVSTFCDFLVDRGLLDENPAEKVRLAKLEKLPPRYLTVEEVRTVLAVGAAARRCPFVGSAASDVYHGADCASARRIGEHNLIGFDSAAAASHSNTCRKR